MASTTTAAQPPASDVPADRGDPLPSWNDTATKKAILAFVDRVTKQGSPEFVPEAERVATFDNDGTLWAEQPMYFQVLFALDRVKALAPQHPEWRDKEPFASLLEGDVKSAFADGEKAIMAIALATHSGMTCEEFDQIVRDWTVTAKHPMTGRLYTETIYQPMLELTAYLRATGFKTFIVSAGGVDFMRLWTERVYGIPPKMSLAAAARPRSSSATVSRYSYARRKSTSLTMDPANPSPSDGTLAGIRLRHSAIPMATWKCFDTRWVGAAPASLSSCTTPTPSANGRTTASRRSVVWIRRSTKPRRKAGPSST